MSLAVLGSRLLGLVREQLMAALFGAGFLTDAFNIGFRLPNLLRDLFAEGVLSVAFVKTFTDYLTHKGADEAWRLANLVISALTIIVSALVIVGILFTPQLVELMARGFTPEKAALAVTLTRLMFPFVLLVTLASVVMGVLNVKGKFGVPASASTLFNLGAIIGGLVFAYLLSGGGWRADAAPDAVPDRAARLAITGMALGTLIGGILQLVIQFPSLRAIGFKFRFIFDFADPGLRRVMRLMGPAIIGTASVQINVLVNTFYASQIDAGISWLNFAFRLMQFPIGLFGVAIGTATLPAISRQASAGEFGKFRDTLAESMGLVFFLTIPSACGLIVLARPITSLIYQHGQFTAFDTDMVAATLAAYSLGLVGYAALKILSPAFYALDDARTPMILSLLSIGLNAVLSYALFRHFSNFQYGNLPGGAHYGHVGLALSTSIVALFNSAGLLFLLRRRLKTINGGRIYASLWRILLASAALSLVSYFSYRALASVLQGEALIVRLGQTIIPVVGGAATFFAITFFLKVREFNVARSILNMNSHLDR